MPIADDPPPPPPDDSPGGFWGLLGMAPMPPSRPDCPGRVKLRVREEHLRSLGLLHGGVAATMLDSFLGRAAASVAPPGHHVVTIQLNLHFVRAARLGDLLIADGEIQHAGRRTAVVRGELRTDSGDLVATGSGTFMHLPTDPDAPPGPVAGGA